MIIHGCNMVEHSVTGANYCTGTNFCRAFTKPGLWTGLDFGLDYGLTTLLNYSGSFLSDFSYLANQTLL